jgi:UDP-N-acetylglucosamine 4-epimerase
MESSDGSSLKFSSYRFLVTGGAGFIGSHLVRFLLEKGARVRVMDNLLTGSRENLADCWNHPRLEFLEADIRDRAACEQACQDMDILSHQAALGSIPRSVNDPFTTHQINSTGFLNMLNAARESRITRIVYASSSSVYGDAKAFPMREDRIGQQLSPYGVSKYSNELYARVFAELYGLKIMGLRYFNVFGPGQNPKGPYAAVIPLFISLLKEGKRPFINGDGRQTRDFTFVENVVQANVRAMMVENEAAFGQVFNIACGERYSVLELFQALTELMGVQLAPRFREARPGDLMHSHADISKAQRLLGYEPTVNFRQGLSQTIGGERNV